MLFIAVYGCFLGGMCSVKRKESVKLALFVGKEERGSSALVQKCVCLFVSFQIVSTLFVILTFRKGPPSSPPVRYRDGADIAASSVHAADDIDFLWGQSRNL